MFAFITCRNTIYNDNDIKAGKRESEVYYYLKINCDKLKDVYYTP